MVWVQFLHFLAEAIAVCDCFIELCCSLSLAANPAQRSGEMFANDYVVGIGSSTLNRKWKPKETAALCGKAWHEQQFQAFHWLIPFRS